VRDQKIRVQTCGSSRFDPQLLEENRALGHITRVFYHEDVPGHQVGAGDARELIVRKVPRLDAEDHADRTALHVSLPNRGIKLDGRKEALCVLCVVREDLRTELYLATGLIDAFTHLNRHRARESIDLGVHKRRRFGNDDRSLGIALVPPCLVRRCCRSYRFLELRVGHLVERLDDFPIVWINALVGHALSSFSDGRMIIVPHAVVTQYREVQG